MKYDVITVGSATQDVFLMTGGLTRVTSKKFEGGVGECFSLGAKMELDNVVIDTGGGATNAAATFAHFGFRVGALCQIGRDGGGHAIRRSLQEHRVDTRLLLESKKSHTAYSAILLMPNGERTVFVFRGASATLPPAEVPWKNIQADWMYIASVGGNMPLLKRLFDHAKKNSIRIAWNPGKQELRGGIRVLQPLMRYASVFNVNKEEAELLLQQKADASVLLASLSKIGDAVVVVTDGTNGACVSSAGNMFWSEASKDKPVNRTGAGDAYGSAFVAALMKKVPVIDAMRIGTLNAGGVVSKMGAKNGLLKKWPTARQIRSIRVTKLRV